MKILFIFWHVCALIVPPVWSTDFNTAQQRARQEHKYILLNFSGSDWCGPCVRLRKEIFDDTSFLSFATDHLLLVNADFPRQKKNQLGEDLRRQNNALADKYNPTGIFPFTLLLDSEGKILRSWEGYPRQGANAFLQELSAVHESN